MGYLDTARRALREQQSLGAHRDAPEAPAEHLRLARLGTAYFARKLSELDDAELYSPSRVPGWTRAHVICDIAYQARAISRQVEAATVGAAIAPLYDGEAERIGKLDLGATLPARALRHLFEHASVHLNVVWRDLPGAKWGAIASDADNIPRALSATALERARRLWLGALELDNGARIRDLPPEFQG